MMGLRKAMQEEEWWTASALDTVDGDLGRNGDIELGEAFEHFDKLVVVERQYIISVVLEEIEVQLIIQ